MLDISLQNQSKNYFKPIEYIVNELNYIQMNNGITFSITQINQNINLNEIIYDDNIFSTFRYMKLEVLWYIIKLIDSRGNDIINDEQTQIVEFFLSEKIFDFYCLISSLQKEFFYVIKYIIIKCDVNKVRRKLIESNYDKCNNLVNNSDEERESNDLTLKEFYILCLFCLKKVEDTHSDKISLTLSSVNPAPKNSTRPDKAPLTRNTLPYNHLQATAQLGRLSHPTRGVWLSDCKVNLFWAECSP
jgi:hypothetical protein